MAEKKDAKESKDTTSAGGTAAPVETAAKAKAGGGFKAWLPAIAAVILAPAATFGVAEYVLLPRLQAKLALPAADAHAKTDAAPAAEEHEEEPAEKGHQGQELVPEQRRDRRQYRIAKHDCGNGRKACP